MSESLIQDYLKINMAEYDHEDGLKVLKYLGITNITEEEERIFKEKWDGVYQARNKSIISTVGTLYIQVLPFVCSTGIDPQLVKTLRDNDFYEKLRISELDKELKEGKSLEEILKKGDHKFVVKIK